MATSVMMFNRPETHWDADPLDFMAAARAQWPDAEVADVEQPNGYHLVGVQFLAPGGMGLDGAFAMNSDGHGYFSIRSGTSRPAAEMFAWVREWLGPKNECSIVETGTGRIAEVPYGADADRLLDIIASVQP